MTDNEPTASTGQTSRSKAGPALSSDVVGGPISTFGESCDKAGPALLRVGQQPTPAAAEWHDIIVLEVRDIRAAIAEEFGYDRSRYLAWARNETRKRNRAGQVS